MDRQHDTERPGRAMYWVLAAVLMVLAAAFLFPGYTVDREIPHRSICAARLQHIGKALILYASYSGGKYPPDLSVLVDHRILVPADLLCPGASQARDKAGLASDGLCDYVYIAGQTESGEPENALAYDRAGNHPDEGGNVLFLDGHVQYISPYNMVEELVAETQAYLAARAAGSQSVAR